MASLNVHLCHAVVPLEEPACTAGLSNLTFTYDCMHHPHNITDRRRRLTVDPTVISSQVGGLHCNDRQSGWVARPSPRRSQPNKVAYDGLASPVPMLPRAGDGVRPG